MIQTAAKETHTTRRTGVRPASSHLDRANHPMQGLHDVLGNRAIQRSIAPITTGVAPGTIQRTCACGSTDSSCDCEKQEQGSGLIQRKSTDNSSSAAPARATVSAAMSGQNSGRALDSSVLASMESGFGRDFGNVLVHTDAPAARAARMLHAHAFTTGRDIYFAQGRYQPETREGRRLLAHELTHTIQQGGQTASVSRSPDLVGHPSDPLEHEADRAADRIVSGSSLDAGALHSARTPSAIQRQDSDDEPSAWDRLKAAASGVLDDAKKVASDAEKAAGQVWDDTKKAAGQAWDDTKKAAGQAWDDTKKAAGQVWDSAKETAVNLALKAANALAAKFGGKVTLSPTGGIDITINDLTLSDVYTDTKVLSLGLPAETLFEAGTVVGDFVINAWVGTVYGDPTETIAAGPVRLQNIKLHLDPFSSTYAGSADLTAGAGISGSVEKAHEARLQVVGVIPVGEVPVPIEAKAAVGIRTAYRLIGKGALAESVILGYSGGSFLFRANTSIKLGGLAERDLEAFLSIELEGDEICSKIWPLATHRFGKGRAIEITLPYTYGSGPGGSISKFGALTVAAIPVDDIRTPLDHGHAPEHCLGLRELIDLLCKKGKLPPHLCTILGPGAPPPSCFGAGGLGMLGAGPAVPGVSGLGASAAVPKCIRDPKRASNPCNVPSTAFCQAHHVIPCETWNEPAAATIHACCFDLNGSDNLIMLPCCDYPGRKAAYHRGRTPSGYVADVRTMLQPLNTETDTKTLCAKAKSILAFFKSNLCSNPAYLNDDTNILDCSKMPSGNCSIPCQ